MKLIEFKDLPIGSLFTSTDGSFSPSRIVFQKTSYNFASPINYNTVWGLDQRSQLFGWNEPICEIDDAYITALQDCQAKMQREFAILSHVKNMYLSKNLEHN